jgi:hypothetical protein
VDSSEQPEGLRGLQDRHAAAVERPAADSSRVPKQLGFQRKVDDFSDPMDAASLGSFAEIGRELLGADQANEET